MKKYLLATYHLRFIIKDVRSKIIILVKYHSKYVIADKLNLYQI